MTFQPYTGQSDFPTSVPCQGDKFDPKRCMGHANRVSVDDIDGTAIYYCFMCGRHTTLVRIENAEATQDTTGETAKNGATQE